MWTSKLSSTFPRTTCFICLLRSNIFIVQFLEGGGYQVGTRQYTDAGTGAIFLAPWGTRLAAVVSGIDEDGFWKAFQAFPTHTGHMVLLSWVIVVQSNVW